ncbi:MAG TPA: hypothetical protein DEB40_14725 [Elusimicrobia bacterium]|nr:hypothetical protein [Elusimicrobiota bacterium]HBT62989.1 hypothetical protein [Elusimicrobiota bacterium]
MKTRIEIAILLSALFLLAVYKADQWTRGSGISPEAPAAQALRQVARWPAFAQLVAQMMIEKYGPPQDVFQDRIEWVSCWPWKRIVVSAAVPSAPLEQVIDYYVPDERLGDLARYPHGLVVYPNQGEIAARSESESLNRLNLNLAHDIVTGRRTPEEASRFFNKTLELSAAGKTSPYMERLLFEVAPQERLGPSFMYRF